MTSETRPAYELARLCYARSRQLTADAWVRTKSILLTVRRVTEMTLIVLLGLTIWGAFQICAVAVSLAMGVVYYLRNPSLAVLDAVSLYIRTRRWLQIVAASFVLSLTSWGNGWAQRPMRISVAGGRYTQAVIILDSAVSKAVATMYQLSDTPATTDLEEVLGVFDATGSMGALPEIAFSTYLSGPQSAGNRRETATIDVCIRVKEGAVTLNGSPPTEIEFHSLALDSILRDVPSMQ